jgi:microcompartment protein CcmK/EutM
MRIAEVIGTVTLCQSLPSFQGARLKLAVPLSLDNLMGRARADADPIVLWDELGVGMHDKIAMIEGPESAQAFRPEIKPIDAYNSAILDHIDIDDQPAS